MSAQGGSRRSLPSWIVGHRRLVVAAWALLAILLGREAKDAARRFEAGVRVEGSRAATVEADLAARFRSPYARRLLLVVAGVPRPDVAEGRGVLEEVVRLLDEAPGVGGALSYLDGSDEVFLGRQAGTFLIVGLDPGSEEPEAAVKRLRELTSHLQARLRRLYPAAELAWTGEVPLNLDLRTVSSDDARKAEARAVPAALVLLLLAFGSAVAAVLPLGVGALSVAVTLGGAGLLSRAFHLSILVQNLASMIGLGLGIDYALLMVSRFREALAACGTGEEAAREAIRHAGRTILLSAVPVGIGFAVLLTVPTSELRSIGAAGLLVSGATLLVSCTLLPAVLSWLGPSVNRFALPRGPGRAARSEAGAEGWRRWGRRTASHPLLALALGGLPMLLLAAEARRLETGTLRGDWLPAEPESVRAIHGLEAMGRANLLHVLQVVLDLPPGTGVETAEGWLALRRLTRRLQADPRIARVHALPTLVGTSATADRVRRLPAAARGHLSSGDGQSALVEVLPALRPWPGESAAGGPWPSEREAVLLVRSDAETLARELQAADAPSLTGLAGTSLRVAGLPAVNAEFADAIEGRFRDVLALVAGATFLVLLAGFRSPLVALKAVALNLLTVAASFGAVVLAFQDGHGASLLGLAGPTERVFTIVPILVFGIVFGLSMDYEVFLVARVREGRRAGLSETEAIAEGVGRTGRVITSAAAIMVAVFTAFAMGSFLPVKMIGFALAVAVFLDATLVRMVIGPSLLALAGRWNWWPGEMPAGGAGRS